MQLKIQQLTISYFYTAFWIAILRGKTQNSRRVICEHDRWISKDSFLKIHVLITKPGVYFFKAFPCLF